MPLLGLQIEDRSGAVQLSLHDWADDEGPEDWSHDELLQYEERFGAQHKTAQRRQSRNDRLREKRLARLRDLEARRPAHASRPS